MTYAVKKIFYTLQGEGRNAGHPSVFCRFSGCNLWSGREADRAASVCHFCDTDFIGTDGTGVGRFAGGPDLARAIAACGPDQARGQKLVVLTGGEPSLQADDILIKALQQEEFEVAVETNGTINPPAGIDWLCVNPKSGAPLAVDQGHEIKLVFRNRAHHRSFLKRSRLIFSSSSRWMDQTATPTPKPQCSTAWPIRNGG